MRGLLPRGVPVEGEDDLGRDVGPAEHPLHDPGVLLAERRPARRDGRAHPGEVAGHDVGVALDDDDALGAGDLPLGQVEAVEGLRLLVDGRLGELRYFASMRSSSNSAARRRRPCGR